MTSNDILKADMLDILFDNRNKQYGAYALRKNYNSRLAMALAISLSSILLLFFLMRTDTSSVRREKPPAGDILVLDKIIPPTIKKQEPIIPKQKTPEPPVRQRTFATPVIREDKLVKNPMTDQTDLSKSLISNRNLDGRDASDMPVIKEAVTETPVKKEVEKNIEMAPSREPEFPGGQNAWLNFLRKNLMAPSELEPGETKTVSIQFYVSTDGTVTDFEVVKSAGKIFDNEVIRVLKKMPRWKPAIQNGLAVARAFTQPVTFVGVEE